MAITNISLTAGMRSNLLSLQQTDSLLTRTQERLATGKKVNSALDNAQAFFAASANTNRAESLDLRKDAMGQAIQVVKAADAGITAINSLLDQAVGIVATAKGSLANTADDATLASQYNEIISQINDIVDDSGYSGTNLLKGLESLTVVFNAAGDNSLTISGVSSDTTTLAVTTAFDGATGTTLDTITTEIAAAKSTLQSTSTSLSGSLGVINARQEFTDSMVNVLETGADKLTLADTNEEGANMLALQTRQQLGTISLSLANQSAQAVLQLF
jgi:flagellin